MEGEEVPTDTAVAEEQTVLELLVDELSRFLFTGGLFRRISGFTGFAEAPV